jgi:putative Holliday junction resolvase
MKILGIDYGDKRIGLAIAESGSRATAPFRILENNKNLFIELKNIIKEEIIEKVIVGLPLSLKNQETEQTQKVKEFINQLKQRIELPIEIFDERLTSKIYRKLGKRRIDDLAAMNILESYLTANK